MPVAAERGISRIVEGMTRALRSLTGGHSPEEEADTKRLAAGIITKEDRERYKTDQTTRIFNSRTAFGFQLSDHNFPPIIPPNAIRAVREEEGRLTSLSLEGLNSEIQTAAQAKAKRWGLLD